MHAMTLLLAVQLDMDTEQRCVWGGGCVEWVGECACYDPPPRCAAGYGHRTEVCVGGRVCGVGGCVRSEGVWVWVCEE